MCHLGMLSVGIPHMRKLVLSKCNDSILTFAFSAGKKRNPDLCGRHGWCNFLCITLVSQSTFNSPGNVLLALYKNFPTGR